MRAAGDGMREAILQQEAESEAETMEAEKKFRL